MVISVQLPDSATLGRTQAVIDTIQQSVLKLPGVADVVGIAGISAIDNSASLSNAGTLYVTLKDWSQRTTAAEGLRGMYDAINAAVAPIQGAKCSGYRSAGDPGYRQRRRLHHAGRTARRQRRFLQAAGPDTHDPQRCARIRPRSRAAQSSFRANVPQVYVAVEPGEGREPGRDDRPGVPDAGHLCRLQLRRPDQSFRPDLPGLCAGRSGCAADAGGDRGSCRCAPPTARWYRSERSSASRRSPARR